MHHECWVDYPRVWKAERSVWARDISSTCNVPRSHLPGSFVRDLGDENEHKTLHPHLIQSDLWSMYIYIHKIENPGNAKHCLKPVLLLRGLGSFPEFFSTIHEQNFVPLVMFWKKKTITIYRCVCIVEYIHHYIHLHVLGYVAYQLAKLCPSTVPP